MSESELSESELSESELSESELSESELSESEAKTEMVLALHALGYNGIDPVGSYANTYDNIIKRDTITFADFLQLLVLSRRDEPELCILEHIGQVGVNDLREFLSACTDHAHKLYDIVSKNVYGDMSARVLRNFGQMSVEQRDAVLDIIFSKGEYLYIKLITETQTSIFYHI